MITFLSSAKPFRGLNAINQMNAVRSWKQAVEDAEVILYGDTEGLDRAAKELGVDFVPNIETDEFGTPLFRAIADHARLNAKYDLQAYINCDILLTKEFIDAVKRIPFPRFLMIGQRIDMIGGSAIDVTDQNWKMELASLARSGGACLHPPGGSDYFVFPRALWQGLPPVAIGRIGYDSALIAYCLENGIPVLDATLCAPAIHQHHDYGNLGKGAAFQNMRYSSRQIGLSLEDATWKMDNTLLYHAWSRGDWLRSLETYIRFSLNLDKGADLIRILRRAAYRLGISRPRAIDLTELLEKFEIASATKAASQ